MTSLTLSDAGKQFAIKANAVEGLCPLLDDENWKVRANAAGSIMSIAIDDMGKVSTADAATKGSITSLVRLRKTQVATIDSGGIEKLVTLLRDPERLVKLNTLKAIGAVCPHPKWQEECTSQQKRIGTSLRIHHDLNVFGMNVGPWDTGDSASAEGGCAPA